MALKTLDPKNVQVIFGSPISGFAPDTKITVEYNEEAFTLQVGVDGEGTRVRTNNDSGRVTLNLQQSSDSNDFLSATHLLDRESGDGILPLYIRDSDGRTLFTAEKAWVVQFPTSAIGSEAQQREWIIETDRLVSFVGGN